MLDFDDREAKQRNALKKINQKLKGVKIISEDMRDELDVEEECIEDLEVAIENASETVVSATDRVKRLQNTSGAKWHIIAVSVLCMIFVVVCVMTILLSLV